MTQTPAIPKIQVQSATKVPHGLALSNGHEGKKNPQNNPFPADCFPQIIQNAINATNATLGYPKDFSGLSVLAAASVAIGNTLRVEVRKGFIQSAVIYAVNVGRPGTSKSPTMNYFLNPIKEMDKDFFKDYKRELQQYDELSSYSQKEREEKGLTKPEEPTLKKSIVSDFTPEALVRVHSNNLRGLCVYSDEIAGFLNNMNRYHNSGEIEFWLSNHSLQSIIIDRNGPTPVFIQNPFISVLGSIQPGIIDKLAKDGRGGNGFIERFIFAWPDDLQVNEWSDNELDPNVTNDYCRIIRNIIEKPLNIDHEGNIQPKVLRYSPEAYAVLKDWQKKNAALSNLESNQEFSGIYSKLELYTIRFSLILQALYWSAAEDDIQHINLRAVEGAIKLTEYFRVTSEKVFNIIYNGIPTDNLTLYQKNLYDALPQSFNTKEGIGIALLYEVPERTFKRLLKNKELFTNVKHGEYCKADGTSGTLALSRKNPVKAQ